MVGICGLILGGMMIGRRGKKVSVGGSWTGYRKAPEATKELTHQWLARRGFRYLPHPDAAAQAIGVQYKDHNGTSLTDYFVKEGAPTPLFAMVTIVPHSSPNPNETTRPVRIYFSIGCRDAPWPWEFSSHRAELESLPRELGEWLTADVTTNSNE